MHKWQNLSKPLHCPPGEALAEVGVYDVRFQAAEHHQSLEGDVGQERVLPVQEVFQRIHSFAVNEFFVECLRIVQDAGQRQQELAGKKGGMGMLL